MQFAEVRAQEIRLCLPGMMMNGQSAPVTRPGQSGIYVRLLMRAVVAIPWLFCLFGRIGICFGLDHHGHYRLRKRGEYAN